MRKKFSSNNIAIIVTSVGENYLYKCIKSIKNQNSKIGQLIVSIPKECKEINISKGINIIKSKYKNQVYQRKQARKHIKKNIKIILQLDCKFILNKNAIKEITQLWNDQTENVAGIGFIPQNYNLPKVTLLQRLLNINSNKIGKVLKSGNVSAWHKKTTSTNVEWLHGGCVTWNLKYCKDLFKRNYPIIEWSVAEDLLYSFRKQKKFPIKITNKIKIKYIQSISSLNIKSSFKRGFLHAKIIKNFVKHEKELSLFLYYYSMIFSSILGIIYSLSILNLQKLSMFFGRLTGSFTKTYNYKVI